MKVILLNPPDIMRRKFYYSVGVPLGIATLKGYLNENKISNTEAIDCKSKNIRTFFKLIHKSGIYGQQWYYGLSNNFMNKVNKKREFPSLKSLIEKGLSDNLEKINPFYKFLEKTIPSKNERCLIGFSVSHTSQLRNSIAIARRIKSMNKNAYILFGGPMVSKNINYLAKKQGLIPTVDGFIIGDGRKALLELIKTLKIKKDTSNVPDLYSKSNTGYKRPSNTSKGMLFTLPDYDFTDLDCLTLQLSRGCYWNKCAFCTYCNQNNYSIMKVNDAFDYIKEIVKRYNPKKIMFTDDAIPAKYLKELSEKMIDEKLNITWKCFNLTLEKEFLKDSIPKIMHKAGCRSVRFGLESMSARVLKLMEKKHDPKTALNVLRKFKKAGVMVKLNVMFGFPTETKDEAHTTLNFLKNNRTLYKDVMIQQFSLEEGTKIFRSPKIYGITRIYKEDKIHTKRLGFMYDVNKGMNTQEAEEFREFTRNELKDKCSNEITYFIENN